jgi:hypothetical protein
MEYQLKDFYPAQEHDLVNSDHSFYKHGNLETDKYRGNTDNMKNILMKTYIGGIGIAGLFILYRVLYT